MTCSSLGAKQLCHPASGDSVSQRLPLWKPFPQDMVVLFLSQPVPFLHLHCFVCPFIFQVQLRCHLLCKAAEHSGESVTLSCSSV